MSSTDDIFYSTILVKLTKIVIDWLILYLFFIISQLIVLFLEGSRAGTPSPCSKDVKLPTDTAVEPASRTHRRISHTGRKFRAAASVVQTTPVDVVTDTTRAGEETIEAVPDCSGNVKTEDIGGIKAENVDDVI